MEIFNKSHFITMPWKNGGGETLELYRLQSSHASGFSFRLSCAKVETNGPFSLFLGIDRILLLLEGNGFCLSLPGEKKLIDKPLIPIYFSGETPIHCELISGAARDFNVMTDRSFGKSTISVICPTKEESLSIIAECDFKFIYDTQKEILYKLGKNEQYNLTLAANNAALVIDLTIYG